MYPEPKRISSTVFLVGLTLLVTIAGVLVLLLTRGEPKHVTLAWVSIGFSGALQGHNRSRDTAERIALEVFDRAKAGEDFEILAEKYSDAPATSVRLCNRGVTPREDENSREQMVVAFGDVGFNLRAGEVGLAVYDPKASPFGWLIIKRLK